MGHRRELQGQHSVAFHLHHIISYHMQVTLHIEEVHMGLQKEKKGTSQVDHAIINER